MSEKDGADAQLAALTKGSKTFTIAGKPVTIFQMSIEQLGKVARFAKPIVETLGVEITLDDIPRIAAEHTDAVIGIAVAASGEDEVWVRRLPVDQFLLLCQAVWEVDQAFFTDHVSPVAKRLAAVMFGAGLMSQSPSPKTDSQNLLS